MLSMARWRGGGVLFVVAAHLLVLLGRGRLEAVDFLRGDVNRDGDVTVADAHMLQTYLFVGFRAFDDCMVAGDANDDGEIDVSDTILIFVFSVLGEPAPRPPSPFPEVGPDPTPDPFLVCDVYGDGSPIEDPLAKLAVLDAIAPGGASRLATFTVTLSSSGSAAGYRGTLGLPPGLVTDGRRVLDTRQLVRVNEDSGLDLIIGRPDGDRLQFGAVLTFPINTCDEREPATCVWIPAGEDTPVLEINLCLPPGTAAGHYPVTFEAGEIIDGPTGRSVRPAELVSGTLTVQSDVEDVECDASPPTPPDVVFELRDATGFPGAAVDVPFLIESTFPSQGFSYSVDFDEEVLRVTQVERLFQRPSGTPYEFQRFEFNNDNEFPGNTGILEGYLVGAAIISLADTEDVLPPGQRVPVLDFRFIVQTDAPPGPTELTFTGGAIGGDGAPVNNRLIAGGREITPEAADSFVFINGLINIIPDVIVFIRGDSNRDRRVDVSDAIRTLTFLFLGGDPLACPDAADADDDGGVNLTDAVYTLDFLFKGGPSLLPPYPLDGVDPTADGLRCPAETSGGNP